MGQRERSKEGRMGHSGSSVSKGSFRINRAFLWSVGSGELTSFLSLLWKGKWWIHRKSILGNPSERFALPARMEMSRWYGRTLWQALGGPWSCSSWMLVDTSFTIRNGFIIQLLPSAHESFLLESMTWPKNISPCAYKGHQPFVCFIMLWWHTAVVNWIYLTWPAGFKLLCITSTTQQRRPWWI